MASKTLLRLNAQKLQLLNLATDAGVVVNNALVVATLTDIDGTVVPELNGVTLPSIDTNGNYSYTIPATFNPASRDDYLCQITASVSGVLMMTLNQSISVSDRTDLSSTSLSSSTASLTRIDVSDLLPFFLTSAGVLVTAAKFIGLYLNNTSGTGNSDLLDSSTGAAYVVPAGKRALVSNATSYNGNASSSTNYFTVKIASSYYRISAGASLSGSSALTATTGPLVLEAGDGLALNATQNAQNAFVRVVEITSLAAVKQGRLTSLASGDNTLYTCPSGKTACILSTGFAATDGANNGQVTIVNDSGGILTYAVNVVRSGGSPTSSNRASAAIGVSAGNRRNEVVNACLNAGDFISVNTSAATATQFAYVIVVEI